MFNQIYKNKKIMDFKEQGFSPVMNILEDTVRLFILTNESYFLPASFNVKQHYMSDRQCYKRMTLKRANTITAYPTYEKRDEENGDYLTDEDVNKMVYGTDLKKQLGPTYVQWTTDDEDLDPSIVSDRLDGVKTDREMDDDPDSPFKPLRREDKMFEDIYLMKKQVDSDFHKIQYLNAELDDDLNYMLTLINRASKFKNTSFHVPPDYIELVAADPTGVLDHSTGWSPITSHSVLSISGIYAIYHVCKSMAKEGKKKLSSIGDLFLHTHYLDFIIKPQSEVLISTFLNLEMKKIESKRLKYESMSKFIDAKLVVLLAYQVQIEGYDTLLKNTAVSFFAPNPAGGVNPYGTQRQLYESFREKIEKDKQKAYDDLNKSLANGFATLKTTIVAA
jgi:hypothetical protein